MIEKFNLQDKYRIAFCILISVASLIFVQRYFKVVFPHASIQMDTTKEEAQDLAEQFLANSGHDIGEYIHASRFGHLSTAKNFLEFERPADEAGAILNSTNSYYWRNRWFIPAQKEEYKVFISTSGKLAYFEHQLDEDTPGDSLSNINAKNIAEFFLIGSIGIETEDWELVDSKTEKLTNRWDHEFEWKEKAFNINKSTHRITVKVQGDKVDYYKEWIKVPDVWKREYAKLRSNNDILNSIGGAGYFISILGIFIFILVRTQKKDVRWKTAFTYASVIAFLLILRAFNQLPGYLYNFDTKETLSVFIFINIVLRGIFIPSMFGLFLGMLIAGAEPAYRDQYPQHLSFRHILSAQGIRSKSFFNSAVIGISLTFSTFAFQTIYYLIATHFGAWSPTEVMNLDRLETYIPWVAVLLGGAIPALAEESISRTFSISFLQKHTKSTLLAVLISSIIWGLGHAEYPAQPFYIRAIEVSAMGIFISWIFIKYGILATLIWHFSVDAVYSAMLLIGSNNPYYFSTGLVCAFVVLLPLTYAIISYRKNGGFIASDHLVNALDTEIIEEKADSNKIIDVRTILEPYSPISTTRHKVGILSALIGIIGFSYFTFTLFINEPINNFNRIDKNHKEAIEIAKDYLISQDFNLDEYWTTAGEKNWLKTQGASARSGGSSLQFWGGGNPKLVKYILEHTNKERLRSLLKENKLLGTGWVIRFFKPEEKREYKVYMRTKYDKLEFPTFEEIISDTAYIPTLSKSNALKLIKAFAAKTKIDLSRMELIEEKEEEFEKRTDYYFKYQSRTDHPDNIAEAKSFVEFDVHGNHIGRVSSGYKLPEIWERNHDQGTFYESFKVFFTLFLCIGLFVLGVKYLLRLIKNKKPNWQLALWAGGLLFIINALSTFNDFEFLWNYDTAEPILSYIFNQILIMHLSGDALLFAVFVAILVLTIDSTWPDFFRAFNKEKRKTYLKDAFTCLIVSFGVSLIIQTASQLITAYHPTVVSEDSFALTTIGYYFPFIDDFFYDFLIKSVLTTFLIAAIYYIYKQVSAKGKVMKYSTLICIAIVFIMPINIIATDILINLIWTIGLFTLIRYYWQGNPWGYLFGVIGFFYIPSLINDFYQIHDPSYRLQLFALVFCIGIFFMYFIKESFFTARTAN